MDRNVEIKARIVSIGAMYPIAAARALMARLGVEPSALVEGAYVDLLAARGGRGG